MGEYRGGLLYLDPTVCNEAFKPSDTSDYPQQPESKVTASTE